VTEAISFLTSIGQAIASMRFYHEGHPARQRATESAYAFARDLLDRDHVPQFTFADGEVIYHRTILHELTEWEWAGRFEKAGIQRLELKDGLTPDEFERFLQEVAARIAGGGAWDAVGHQFAHTGIRFGALELKSDHEATQRIQVATTGMSLSLDREIEAVEWIHGEVIEQRELPLLEAEVVVRSLAIAINRESQVVLPLLRLKEFDQYTTTHSCNVAVLATAFAEHLGFDHQIARSLGVCGLLHDIGKVRIPHEILIKPGRLERAEREIIEQHPVHGARILIERERNLDLAATVSFEHHRWMDGAGYPRRRRDMECHVASRIVQICDVFDALCTDRPYRGGLPPDVALAEIEAESGTHFDSDLVRQFATMIRGSMLRFSSIEDERRSAAGAASQEIAMNGDGTIEADGEDAHGDGDGVPVEGPASQPVADPTTDGPTGSSDSADPVDGTAPQDPAHARDSGADEADDGTTEPA
jgi:putative nucleotidyltransferase with HDIG domain